MAAPIWQQEREGLELALELAVLSGFVLPSSLPSILGSLPGYPGGWLALPFSFFSVVLGQHSHLIRWMPGGTVCLSD